MAPVVKIPMVSIFLDKLETIFVFNEVYIIHKPVRFFDIFLVSLHFLIYINNSKNAFEKSVIHHFSDDTNLLYGTKTLSNIKFAMKTELSVLGQSYQHYVKSVRIRSYSGPYFLAPGLNAERYLVFLRI